MMMPVRTATGAGLTLIMILVGFQTAGFTEENPAQTALQRARAAYQAGEFAACAEYYLQAINVGAADAAVYYDAACCLALSKRPEPAIAFLLRAIEQGYRDFNWLKTDPDPVSLHTHEQWNRVLAVCEKLEEQYRASVNAELYDLFQADQAERMDDDINWDSVSVHDQQRRERVRELLDSGLVKTADDYYHAAMIFQHGTDSSDYLLAHQLARQAVELDSTHANALWLVAASKDRYLHSIDKPQWYGTQFRQVDGVWTIEPIDTTAVTDADRKRLHVPPLSEARRRAAAMNK